MRIVGGNDSPVTATQACGASSSSFGETQDYDVTITGGVAQYTYLWTPNTFLDFDNIANPLASAVNVASQPYSVLVTDAAGCTATGNVTVTTAAPITAATISGNLGYCTGGSTTLTAVPTDGAGPYTYLWAPGGETTAAISVTVVGTYSAQVTDACGGSVNTGNVNVVENSLPVVAVLPTSSNYCTGYPAVALAASGADTYAWLPALGLDATNVANVNASPAATTTYTVTGTTTATGCTNTATSAITVLGAAPVITSTTATPNPVCPGSTSQLQVNTPAPAAYCTTVNFTFNIEAIGNVTFADINNTSACVAGAGAGGALQDFTAVIGQRRCWQCLSDDGNGYHRR
ncbi:MAG: hypothetical protein IPO90_14055 [Flavobacteriales bacterium]|nr:hypothetical protein [Flavobacteriales bacterium]